MDHQWREPAVSLVATTFIISGWQVPAQAFVSCQCFLWYETLWQNWNEMYFIAARWYFITSQEWNEIYFIAVRRYFITSQEWNEIYFIAARQYFIRTLNFLKRKFQKRCGILLGPWICSNYFNSCFPYWDKRKILEKSRRWEKV